MTAPDVLGPIVAGEALRVDLSADECLKCNVCNSVCPVARVTDLFPGPKYVGPQAQRFRLSAGLPVQPAEGAPPPSPDVTVDYCNGCGFCTASCPAGVKIMEINNRARAGIRANRRPPLRDRLIAEPDLLGTLGVPFAPLANAALRSRPLRVLAEVILGIHRRAPLPTFARRTFRSRARAMGAIMATERPDAGLPPPDRAVVYFHGCAANYYEPQVAGAALRVLRRNGFEVVVPPQECCGLPLISNGLYGRARTRARRNIRVLAEYARAGYRIVSTSTSCGHTLKAEYAEMLDLDDADTRAVADATWDIMEFLRDLHDGDRLDTGFGRLDETLPYHAPCQLRSHGIGLPALDLFALVPGLRADDLDHDCCGVAGTYGLKREKYDIAMAVGVDLFDKIEASGAARAACDSETCRWQIEHATGTPLRHPVEILADAYRAADAERAAAGAEPTASGASIAR
jgi:glycerol-3-phosphate dehydrogenase subunit C